MHTQTHSSSSTRDEPVVGQLIGALGLSLRWPAGGPDRGLGDLASSPDWLGKVCHQTDKSAARGSSTVGPAASYLSPRDPVPSSQDRDRRSQRTGVPLRGLFLAEAGREQRCPHACYYAQSRAQHGCLVCVGPWVAMLNPSRVLATVLHCTGCDVPAAYASKSIKEVSPLP